MPAIAYQCANCGGELKFNAEMGKFICEYCTSEFTKEELENFAKEASEKEVEHENQEEVSLYHCPNCGGDIITTETTAATKCYYCHNPVVLSGRLSGKYLPKRIIPFKFKKEVAVDKFYEWTKKKFFLPKDFFSESQIEKLSGVYFPYWIIDSDNDVDYSAICENTSTWRRGNVQYTKHDIYNCQRRGLVHLEDLVKAGLKKSSKKLVESVQPFDEQALEPFSMSYLSGFQAERRDIEQGDIEDEVLGDINHYSEKVVSDTIKGYQQVTKNSFFCNPKHIDWEYGLLPVWTMTYLYKDKVYYYVMNGQTGKMCGKLPVNATKLFLFASISAIATSILGLIVGYFL